MFPEKQTFFTLYALQFVVYHNKKIGKLLNDTSGHNCNAPTMCDTSDEVGNA